MEEDEYLADALDLVCSQSSDESVEDYIEHIGIIRRSGRYPWGSGETPYERSRGFKTYYDSMKAKGLTDPQIAEGIGAHLSKQGSKDTFKTPQLRAAISVSTEQIHAQNRGTATKLKATGMSTSAIAREMKTNESTVRGWLKFSEDTKAGSIRTTADVLKNHLAKKEFLDVGKGTHLYMGVSDVKLKTALAVLKEEGHEIYSIKLPQLGTDKMTTYKILTKPGVTWAETRAALLAGKLRTIPSQSDDNGQTFRTPKAEPVSVHSNRLEVRYGPDGGAKMDGVIELRRGVEDLSLGASKYAQVRIAIDGTHYLKGMAMYADDLPKGVDLRFNTNKHDTGNKLDAMKPMKTADGKLDSENPFGATTHPRFFTDKSGKKQTSPLNIVNEEGKWDEWSRSLSSQMLSKQSVTLASAQLGKAKANSEKELKTILSLTNPVLQRKLLEEYADSADAAAVHLKAAALPRQSTHVILPISTMRPHEVYAPNYNNGEKVVLIRHPHGGPFEIPELTVNNRNSVARRILAGAKDAIGIHHSVAEQLSGADFDGDTVLVIPNDSRAVKTRPPLEKLKGFDAKVEYKIPHDDTVTTRMTKKNTQTEMGKISNLITDMTIHRATDDEISRAVRHSMVVIDAEKHGLDYKRSEIDHGIKALKKTYQEGTNKGANTIISKASSDARVPQRKYLTGTRAINPKTGEKVFIETGATYVNPNTGKTVTKTTKGTKMEFTKDARSLVSRSAGPMELTYADHANAMKALANQARKYNINLTMPKQSPAAKAVYAKEVKSLGEKLQVAHRNAPLERRAQAIGNAMAKAKIDAHPEYDKEDIKKARFSSLEDARILTGANKKKIGGEDVPLTAREWEAIQAGAVSHTMLSEILANAHMPRVRELATPRQHTSLTSGQLARARSMEASGRSMSEIASELGIPRSTLSDNLKRQ